MTGHSTRGAALGPSKAARGAPACGAGAAAVGRCVSLGEPSRAGGGVCACHKVLLLLCCCCAAERLENHTGSDAMA